jgi:hypothetical protein
MRFKILWTFVVLVISLSPVGLAQPGGPLEPDPGEGGGGGGTCRIDSCQTTCTGPQGVECCCFYRCPSGGTWVCRQGQYCSNSHGGCLGLSQTSLFLRDLLSRQAVVGNPFASSTPVASACRALLPSLQSLGVTVEDAIHRGTKESSLTDPSSGQAPQPVGEDRRPSGEGPEDPLPRSE